MRTSSDDPVIRSVNDLDVYDDHHVEDLLRAGLPPIIGPTMLCWFLVDGDLALPNIFVVDDTPKSVTYPEAVEIATSLAMTARQALDDPGLLMIWRRRGAEAPTDADLSWLRAARRACAEEGVRLLGVWLEAGNARPLRLDAPASDLGRTRRSRSRPDR